MGAAVALAPLAARPSSDGTALPQKPATGRPANDHRRILEGMLWVMRTGSAWRFLPEHFGPWQTIHSRYQRWGKAGIWQRIVVLLHPETKLPGELV